MSATTVEAYCPTCGETVQADAQTMHCTRCGKLAMRVPSEEDLRTAAAANQNNAVAPTGTGLRLPSSAAARRWFDQTHALADSFEQAARAAEKRAVDAAAEATGYRRAAAAFLSLLRQVAVEPAQPLALPSGAGPSKRTRRLGARWARAFDACVTCGRTDRPHKAHGLCSACHRPVRRAS